MRVPVDVSEIPVQQDLTIIATSVPLVAAFALLPILQTSVLRVPIGLAFVLFVPGYAFIAALFPEQSLEDDQGIDTLERIVLSFGTSIAIVPLLGLVLNFTPWGIRLVPILLTLGVFTVGATGVAVYRRAQLVSERRFDPDLEGWLTRGWTELSEPNDRTEAILNVVLVLSILLAVGSVAYAVAVPTDGEQFTELYLLTENESGELVADDYPTNFTVGEPKSLIVGIGNHEGEPVDYSLVVELQRVRVHNESVTVQEQQRVLHGQHRVGANETWHGRVSITPELTGERLRLVFLLYRGAAPPEPRVENAYREVHLWVRVQE